MTSDPDSVSTTTSALDDRAVAKRLACVRRSRPFKPYPAGTIRGPFICGTGKGHDTGVQYLVCRSDGAWAPFIGERKDEEAVKLKAEEYSKSVIKSEDGK